ncbi:hypothetical protein ACHAPT_007279 [Fusarium lateritium]
MNTEQQLTKALQAQFENDNADEDRREQIAEQMKHSLLHQHNWEELIHPMPVLVQSIAACFAASRCEMTRGYGPNHPVGKFEQMDQSQLGGNLARCGELGSAAFMALHENMVGVRAGTRMFDELAGDLDEFMEDPDLARRKLKTRVDQLRSYADSACSNIKGIDEALGRWLDHTTAFHAGCLQMQSTYPEKLKSEKWAAAMDQMRFNPQFNASAIHRDATQRFMTQVNLAFSTFKIAAQILPHNSDLLGQQVVRELADYVSTAFGQLLEFHNQNLLPDKRGVNDSARRRQFLYNDPVYAEAKKNVIYFELINAALNGGGDTESLTFAQQMLAQAQNSFQYMATREEPSQQLLSAFDNAIKIANSLGIQGSQSGRNPSIGRNDLQQSYKATYLSVQKLAAIGRALPGSAIGGGPLMGPAQDLRSTMSRTDVRSVQAQAVLESAKSRLTTKQKYIFQSHELYSEAHDKIGEHLSRTTEIIMELGELAVNNRMGLEEIKTILVRSAELIAHVKGQIMSLYRFLKAAISAIDAMNNYIIDPFLETIGMRGAEGKRLANYSLGDFQRTWRKDMLNKIGERDDKAKLVNKDLAPEPATLQAIDSGMMELEKVAKDVIAQRFDTSPLNQFGL